VLVTSRGKRGWYFSLKFEVFKLELAVGQEVPFNSINGRHVMECHPDQLKLLCDEMSGIP